MHVTVSARSGPSSGASWTKSRNHYEHKVPIMNWLYLYRAVSCKSMRDVKSGHHFYRGFYFLLGFLCKMVLIVFLCVHCLLFHTLFVICIGSGAWSDIHPKILRRKLFIRNLDPGFQYLFPKLISFPSYLSITSLARLKTFCTGRNCGVFLSNA